YFFFFQAEDGIRDRNVTGVQTCALPISPSLFHSIYRAAFSAQRSIVTLATFDIINILRRELPQVGCRMSTVASLAGVSSGKMSRSEERRVGKECRTRRWGDD